MSITIKNVTFRAVAFVMVLLCSLSFAIAQPGRFGGKMTVNGYILDSKTGEPLIAATVKATSSDGGTGSFAITDENGKFALEVPRPGKYTLEFNYVGYKEMIKDVQIMPNRTNIGKFNLKEDPRMLAEVEAIGHADRIKQRGDTLAYNADAYKVQDGASAEELVSKMPGIEVTSEGVKAQGETVQKILVDGKEFFDNDLRMALKSLPAEIVESVNVYDKKSDQAEFTGIDDGETVKAMDLTTKSYSRNGVFGKIIGGFGNNLDFDNPYWKGDMNLNIFNGDRRITIQAMSNNVNERNFSNDDMASGGGMMMGRMWTPRGVARTNGAGVNFSDNYLGGKLDVQLSYFFNQGRTYATDTTYTDDLNKDASSFSSSSSLSHSMSHRIGGRISYKPTEKDEILIRPSVNFQSSDSRGETESRSWNYKLDSVSIDKIAQYRWDDFLSKNNNITGSETDSWNVRANVLWRHRLNKPGRTFSINVNGGASGSDSESTAIRKMILGGVKNDDNQMNTNDNNNSSLSGNIQYTEPIVTGLNLSLRYDINYSKSKRDTEVDYYDSDTFTGSFTSDARNTNTYEQKNLRNSGELGLSYNYKTLRINASSRFQHQVLEGDQDYYLMGDADKLIYNINTKKNYFSVLPNFRLEYRTAGGTQFRINYRSSVNNPSIQNLQKSVNTTNPLSYSTGNPDLDQSRSHNVHFNMIYTNTETAQNFMIFGGFNATQNQISNQTLTNHTESNMRFADIDSKYGFGDDIFKNLELAPGGTATRPINRDGYKSVFINAGWGFPFDLIMSNVNLSVGGNYGLNPSNKLYYETVDGENVVTSLETKTRTLGFTPRLHISSNISTDLNFNVLYSPAFEWVHDSEGNTDDRDYLTHNFNANLNWTFWQGFTTEQAVSYAYYGGPAMPEAISQWIWNASIGKKFLKGKAAEIKLQAYDILGSNKGYTRSVGDSSISTSFRNFMPRYVMLTFTYKISAYRKGGKQATRTEDTNQGFGRGMGGPGFGPGPGGRF